MSHKLSEYIARKANGNGSLNKESSPLQQIQKPTAGEKTDQMKNNGHNNGGSWEKFEDVLFWFEKDGTMPPLLSPILPEKFGGDVMKLDIPEMLSPTLPDIYNDKKRELRQDKSDREDSDLEKKQNNHDKEGKPRQALPTQPPVQKKKTNEIRQPIPQRPNALSLSGDDGNSSSSDKVPNKTTKRKSYERTEHFGVHSYRLVETSNSKSLFLTLHVPSYYKNKRKKNNSSTKLQGLGIRQRTFSNDNKPVEKKSPEKSTFDQKAKKSSVFKTASKESPKATSPKSSGSSSSSSLINGHNNRTSLDDKDLDHSSLMAKSGEYLKMAKDRKHKGDELRSQDLKLSITYFMDSLIIYLVGFNYEDQSRRLLKKLYFDKNWLSLISLIDHSLQLSTSQGFTDITGLCFQIKAVVYEHVCKILDEYITLNNLKRRKAKTDEEVLKIDDSLINHYKNFKKYKEQARRSLIESEGYLSIFKLQKKYPSIVESFENQPNKDRLAKDTDFFLDPSHDHIQLPINNGVTLKEICAYSLRVMKQWCNDENLRYTDWTF